MGRSRRPRDGNRPKSQYAMTPSVLHLLFLVGVVVFGLAGPMSPATAEDAAVEVIFAPEGSCYGPLRRSDSDGDGRVNATEYIDFVNRLSDGFFSNVDGNFSALPLGLKGTFNYLACLCADDDDIDDQCCVGDNAGIELAGTRRGEIPTDEEALYLLEVCRVTLSELSELDTPQPTGGPPTSMPTTLPSPAPTFPPSLNPSPAPSDSPTLTPTDAPTTLEPSSSPSALPSTLRPSFAPTAAPVLVTNEPTTSPTFVPTLLPSLAPSAVPSTIAPTVQPSPTPTIVPTSPAPTLNPTLETVAPTELPVETDEPTGMDPTPDESLVPTEAPIADPNAPTASPDAAEPTVAPIADPAIEVTDPPADTLAPSFAPVEPEAPTLEPGGDGTGGREPSNPPVLDPDTESDAPTLPPFYDEPSAAPVSANGPTLPPSSNVALSGEPTEAPIVEADAPTASPSDNGTALDEPTAAPIVDRDAPTLSPLQNVSEPSASPIENSVPGEPTVAPIVDPDAPTLRPSETETPPAEPSVAPITAPVAQPTDENTGSPTQVSVPSAPSPVPSPSSSPGPTLASQLIEVPIKYFIMVDSDIASEDILSATGNSVAQDLVGTMEALIPEVLGTSSSVELSARLRRGLESHRRLTVTMTEGVPPAIKNVTGADCPVGNATEGTTCHEVDSAVALTLVQENPVATEKRVSTAVAGAIDNGRFLSKLKELNPDSVVIGVFGTLAVVTSRPTTDGGGGGTVPSDDPEVTVSGTDGGGGTEVALIVAGAVGMGVLVAVVSGFLFLTYRRTNRQKVLREYQDEPGLLGGDDSTEGGGMTSSMLGASPHYGSSARSRMEKITVDGDDDDYDDLDERRANKDPLESDSSSIAGSSGWDSSAGASSFLVPSGDSSADGLATLGAIGVGSLAAQEKEPSFSSILERKKDRDDTFGEPPPEEDEESVSDLAARNAAAVGGVGGDATSPLGNSNSTGMSTSFRGDSSPPDTTRDSTHMSSANLTAPSAISGGIKSTDLSSANLTTNSSALLDEAADEQDQVLPSVSRADLESAIKAGDWAAVGATATLLAAASENQSQQSSGVSSRSSRSTTTSKNSSISSAIDPTRAAELDHLVDSGDWEGVVLAAAKYEKSADENFENSTTRSQSNRSVSSDDRGGSNTTLTDPSRSTTDQSIGASSVYTPSVSTSLSETPSKANKRAEIRVEVEALVRRVVPDEIDNVDEMMLQFKGREEELVETLRTMQERSIAQRARAAVHRSAKREARKSRSESLLSSASSLQESTEGGKGAASATGSEPTETKPAASVASVQDGKQSPHESAHTESSDGRKKNPNVSRSSMGDSDFSEPQFGNTGGTDASSKNVTSSSGSISGPSPDDTTSAGDEERMKTPKKPITPAAVGSARDALERAIEEGDWDAVGDAAAMMESASAEIGNELESPLGSRRRIRPEGGVHAVRAAQLDNLIESGDWSGVVSAATKFSKMDSQSDVLDMDDVGQGVEEDDDGVPYRNRYIGKKGVDKAQGSVNPYVNSGDQERDALDQADMWMKIAEQNRADGGPGDGHKGASDAADWAISRSLSALQMAEQNRQLSMQTANLLPPEDRSKGDDSV